METGHRVREVRKHYDLNQTDFGKRIGLKQAVIGQIENGSRNLTERTALQICDSFGVDYEWLMTGEGEMMVDNSDAIDALIDAMLVGEKETAKAVFKALARLGGDEWAVFKKFILDAAKKLEK